jgi:hypothetical protein
MARNDNSLLEAALIGYRQQVVQIEAAIAEIEKRLGNGRGSRSHSGASPTPKAAKKHRISAEGRRRIAEAQRKRWAAQKGTKA